MALLPPQAKGLNWPCSGPEEGPQKVSRDESLSLSKEEMEQVRRIARRDGISEGEAATKLIQSALARRVRKRTGKGPAKVYPVGRK